MKLLRMVEIWVPEKASVVQVKQKDLYFFFRIACVFDDSDEYGN